MNMETVVEKLSSLNVTATLLCFITVGIIAAILRIYLGCLNQEYRIRDLEAAASKRAEERE